MPELARLVRIELVKLRTTGTPYLLAATAILLTALDAVLRASRAGNRNIPPLSTADGQVAIATLTGFAILMALTLGATTASGEFRHATATITYLEFPNRGRVMVAKMIASGAAGMLMAALGAAAANGVGLAFVAGQGDQVLASAGTLTRDGLGAMAGAGLLAMVGAAVGSVLRSQLAVTVGALVWGLFVESIVGGLYNSVAPYLPFTAATTLGGAPLGSGGLGFSGGGSDATALPFGAAAALIASVAIVLAAAAARTALRRDIT